jgi:hypothetical protein
MPGLDPGIQLSTGCSSRLVWNMGCLDKPGDDGSGVVQPRTMG